MDIRLLAEYLLRTSTVCPAKAGRITSLTEIALEAIEKHTWPGNVRELRNVIDRAILLETTDKIGLSSIFIDYEHSEPLVSMWMRQDCQPVLSRVEGIEPHTQGAWQASPVINSPSDMSRPGDFSLDKAERELIARALQESGWQKTRAATLLGITRATLYAKVKQHNIQRGTYIPKLDQDNSSSMAEPEPVTAS
jgi:DNA-binding NtrC family response regulator